MIETKSLQDIAMDFVESRSEKSFTILHNRLKPGLRNYVHQFHQDPEIVDEILAITLSKAFIYVGDYDPRWNFSTWIYRICRNECLMEIRRQNSISSLDTLVDSKTAIKAVNDEDWKIETDYEFFSDEETIHAHTLYDEILEEISNLPVHYKEIIQDRIVEKLKYKEIAEKRNLLINTVRSRIHSAKKVIRNLWIDKKKKGNSKTINILGVTILNLLDDDKVNLENSAIEFDIISAKYGADDKWVDVTEKTVKSLHDKREVKSCNRLGGDPCYGLKKSLVIEYTKDGEKHTVDVKEGKTWSVN